MLVPLWIFKTLAAILIIVVLGLAVIGAMSCGHYGRRSGEHLGGHLRRGF